MALFGSKTKTEDKKNTKATPAKVTKDTAKGEASMKDLYAEATPSKTSTKAKVVTAKFSNANRLLVRPLITEKATNLATESKYAFVVEKGANKIEVAKAITSIYGVKPLAVNIINMKGKQVSRGRIRGQRKDWKKAVVTLKKGDSIAIYEGV